jgi:DNA-3-methyladenine glycosylase II
MTPREWNRARTELAGRDPVLARLMATLPASRRLQPRDDPFTALARSIVGQQISVKAASSVWERLLSTVPEFCPAALAEARVEALRACGLSRQKVAYLQSLAEHFHLRRLDPLRWRELDDEGVVTELTSVKGIGRWTAQMFLIFHLQRPDVLPLGDLGLQRAVSLHYNRGRKVTEARMQRIAQPWAPWRSVATWYLWRSLDGEG